MALFTVNFVSKCLNQSVTMNVILPVDKDEAKEHPDRKYKTLYLLHGLFGNYTDWITGTNIERWANDRNLCVVMPSGANSFYFDFDQLPNMNFGTFIGEELVDITRRMFPLSHKKEDTFIAGLSMGGFGALRCGLEFYNTFGYIAGLSSALHAFEYDENDPRRAQIIGEFDVFGKYSEAVNSRKNPRVCAKLALDNLPKEALPKIFMCCGTEDGLFHSSTTFRDFLTENGFDVTWEEGPGVHNWDFWNEYIQHVLNWLPLSTGHEGLSSGNVQGE